MFFSHMGWHWMADTAASGGEGEGEAWDGGVEEGWREKADQNMFCHTGVAKDGSKYGRSSTMMG